MAVELAIDLGSTNTVIYKLGSGIVLREPSVVYLELNPKSYNVKEVGLKAKKMLGRTDEFSAVVYPIVEGGIKNEKLTTEMLKTFINKVVPQKILRPRIKVLLLLPCGLTEEEILTYKKVVYGANVNKVKIIPNIVASFLGEETTTIGNKGVMVVNIGGGTTEIGVLSNNVIINGCSLSIGGRTIDNAIADFIETTFNLKISEVTAEKIKNDIGSLFDVDKSNIEFAGVDILTGQPQTQVIHACDLKPVIENFIEKIALTIETILKGCSPEIIEDVSKVGLYISGGVSQITGLESFLRKRLNLPVTISNNYDNAPTIGAGKVLGNPNLLNII